MKVLRASLRSKQDNLYAMLKKCAAKEYYCDQYLEGNLWRRIIGSEEGELPKRQQSNKKNSSSSQNSNPNESPAKPNKTDSNPPVQQKAPAGAPAAPVDPNAGRQVLEPQNLSLQDIELQKTQESIEVQNKPQAPRAIFKARFGPASFLSSAQKNVSQDDETRNDAPSLSAERKDHFMSHERPPKWKSRSRTAAPSAVERHSDEDSKPSSNHIVAISSNPSTGICGGVEDDTKPPEDEIAEPTYGSKFGSHLSFHVVACDIAPNLEKEEAVNQS
ncbi:hypothetical protein KIN20_029350 [Parelaphostrongylus tenuis]|uniref:Uncharacterized protein n=1 Tax=Parelaphostrongylus tenuis TaxID=148309 RepID=A0AAD5R2H8_PARTN|nr:hypothetical protein KIN20_029350 [Parelaphostrongylus tenuis]